MLGHTGSTQSNKHLLYSLLLGFTTSAIKETGRYQIAPHSHFSHYHFFLGPPQVTCFDYLNFIVEYFLILQVYFENKEIW